MRTPSPVAAAISEESAFIPVRFDVSAVSHEVLLAVDSESVFQLVLYVPEFELFSLELFRPDGSRVTDMQSRRVDGNWPIGGSGQMAVAPSWRFEQPFPRGMWRAVVTRRDKSLLRVPGVPPPKGHPDAYLLLWNDSPKKIFSHLGTYDWTLKRTVGITAQMYDASVAPPLVRGQRPAVLGSGRIAKAKLEVYFPSGSELEVDMSDNGTVFDLLANDHVYGGKFEAADEGMYRVTALFEGTLDDGTPFMRSVSHAMVTVKDEVDIPSRTLAKLNMKQASAANVDQVSVFVPVDAPDGMLLRTYAELYGTKTGEQKLQKAACWIGGYSLVQNGQVELEFNKRWLTSAGVAAPLTLRQVTLYDAYRHIPLATADEVPIQGSVLLEGSAALAANEKPTEEMLKGVRPARFHHARAKEMRMASAEPLPSLVLLHGYCAKNNPWVQTPTIPFSDYYVFDGALGKSVLNQEFAELVLDETQHLPSFGLVGHSQGGMTALHLHNFFWSPADAVEPGKRPVQSVGSPYLGVTGAGAALDLGSLFGVGCGENFDLTIDGANLWLAGISAAARANVFFYTTTWKDSGFIKYCNLASNLVLTWPNDGTAEYEMCQLPGANPVGDNPTRGECHTPDMNWPPQTENIARNTEINANAAR